MAKTVRSRRVTIAAGALSLALVAPFVSPVDVTPVAAAVDADAFNARYNTTNFWDADEAVVQGLVLEPGDTVSATANTIFNWKFRTSGCNLIIGRPQSSTAFRTGNQDIAVQVTKADGSSFNTTLRVNVVDTRAAGNKFSEPADNCPAPTSTATPTSDAPAATTTTSEAEPTSAVEPTSTTSDAPAPTTTTSEAEPTSAAPESSTSEAPKTTATTFSGRYDTANFWNKNEALVEGLELQPGDSVSATTNTIFNWRFRNDDGALTVIRPQSAAAFRTGEVDIPVRVTTPQGDSFTTTLRLNVIDEAPPAAYKIPPVETRETIDFEGGRSKVVDAWDVPEGVTVDKQVGFQSIGVVGWDVDVQNGKLVVKAPGTFTSGDDVDIPVTFTDGITPTDATVRIRALNPQTTGRDIAGTVGTIVGNVIGAATGTGSVGNIVGGLLGGGSGEGGTGGGGGLGGLIGGLLGGGSGEGGGLLEGLVKVEVQPSAVIVTGNANPTVEIRDNGSNNGSGNSVVVTDNANPRDNFSNNSVEASAIVTGNANPVVTGNLNDNGSNNSAVVTGNANPTVVITGNANPVVTGNLNDNGSNNSAVVTGNANPTVVITGNANPVVTGNLNDNGSNNSAVVTGNANPTVVITGNANDNFRENGSNNSAVVTGNANPTVVITGNANPVVTGNANDNFRENGSNNSAVVTGNANPVITGNANPSDIGSNNSVVVTGNANPVVTGNANDNGSNNSAVVTGNANPVITGNLNPSNNGSNNSAVVTGNANPSDIGSNNSAVVTGNANPTVVVTGNANNNGTGNTVMVTGNANPVVTGNANGGLLGGSGSSGGSSKRDAKKDPGLVDTNLNTEGGSSDPRCIAPLVALGLPLIPLALAQGLNIPGLDRAAKQAENAFDDATRRLNIPADQAMAIGGGIAGVVAALLITATVRNCIPRPKSFDINVNVPQPQGVVTSVAPVVDTPTA